jgi:hypothetical protein
VTKSDMMSYGMFAYFPASIQTFEAEVLLSIWIRCLHASCFRASRTGVTAGRGRIIKSDMISCGMFDCFRP